MVTKTHVRLPAKTIDDSIRSGGRCNVHLQNTPILFEVTRRGVEVIYNGNHYTMYQERNIERDCIVFRVTVDGRWECLAAQEGFDGMSYFEVIDKAGDPFKTQYKYEQYGVDVPLTNDAGDPLYRPGEYVSVGALTSPAYEKKKVLLLCP